MSNNNSFKLVDVRRCLKSDTKIWQGLENGAYEKIGQWHYFPKGEWKKLRGFEREQLRVLVAGREVYSAVLVGRSAAVIQGLWTIGSEEVVELALSSGFLPSKKQRRKGSRYRRMILGKGQIEDRYGVRCVSRARAVVDVARLHGFAHGLVAADCFLASEGSVEELRRECEQLGRVKKLKVVRRVIEEAITKSESAYESYARALLLEAGIEAQAQVWVLEGVRVDLLAERVVIEVDGEVKYEDAPGDVIRLERNREKKIQNAGYVVVRVSPKVLLNDPEGFVDMVRLRMRDVA